jgi:fumarate reductase flavoprotein subunit
LLSCVAFAEGANTLTASAKGFGSDVAVEVTVEDGKITALTVDDSGESYPAAGVAREDSVEKLIAAILEAGSTEGVDAKTGATFTSTAVIEAINAAMAGGASDAPVAFTAGEYEATADGYNGPVTVSVTYTEDAIESIEIVSSVETDHVGTLAYDIMIPEMIEANGSGVDGVSGAL